MCPLTKRLHHLYTKAGSAFAYGSAGWRFPSLVEVHDARKSPGACHDYVDLHKWKMLARTVSGRHPCGSEEVSCLGIPMPVGGCLQASAFVGRPLGESPAREPCCQNHSLAEPALVAHLPGGRRGGIRLGNCSWPWGTRVRRGGPPQVELFGHGNGSQGMAPDGGLRRQGRHGGVAAEKVGTNTKAANCPGSPSAFLCASLLRLR